MTSKQLSVIAKRVRDALGEMTAKGALLFFCPIGHVLRCVAFERSSDPRGFYTWAFIQPLAIPSERRYFNLGFRLARGKRWNADSPAIIEAVAAAIRQEAVPFLEDVKTPRDAALTAKRLGPVVTGISQRAIAYCFAVGGDTRQAIRELDRYLEATREDPNRWFQRERAEALELRHRLLTSPRDAQQLLEIWERMTIEALGLSECG
jgi:hypothetical protein